MNLFGWKKKKKTGAISHKHHGLEMFRYQQYGSILSQAAFTPCLL